MKYPKTHAALSNAILKAAADFGENMPYAIIQPCLINKRECKVVCINGCAKYHTIYGSGNKFVDDIPLLNFAEKAIRTLKTNCPTAIVDGLVRVDVMCRFNGSMIVNEFESLEAMFSTSNLSDEASIKEFLDDYWFEKLQSIFQQFVFV